MTIGAGDFLNYGIREFSIPARQVLAHRAGNCVNLAAAEAVVLESFRNGC